MFVRHILANEQDSLARISTRASIQVLCRLSEAVEMFKIKKSITVIRLYGRRLTINVCVRAHPGHLSFLFDSSLVI